MTTNDAAIASPLATFKRQSLALASQAIAGMSVAVWIAIGVGHTAGDTATILVLTLLLIFAAVVSLSAAGPKKTTIGMALCSLVGVAFLLAHMDTHVTGQAALAVMFGAGAAWTTSYVWAGSGRHMPKIWAAMIWSSLAFTVWAVAISRGGVEALGADGAGAVYGVLTLIGVSRVALLARSLNSRSLSRAEMFDEGVVRGMPALLLSAFSLVGVFVNGSPTSWMLLAASLSLLIYLERHAFSRTRGEKKSRVAPRLFLAAFGAAMAAAAARYSTGGLDLDAIGVLYQDVLALAQQAPLSGHGFGAYEALVDQTIAPDVAAAIPEQARVYALPVKWLLEAGLIGALFVLIVWAAMLVAVCRSFQSKTGSKTLSRLALSCSFYLISMGLLTPALEAPSVVWLYAAILGLSCGANAPKHFEIGGKSST